MKKTIGLLALAISSLSYAAPQTSWLTVDNDVLAKVRPSLNKSVQTIYSAQGASVVEMSPAEVEMLGAVIHDKLHRCGGFIAHDSLEEAKEALSFQGEMYFAKSALFADYDINQRNVVQPMVAQVTEPTIRQTIINLSAFNNRYYKSETGVKSSEYIAKMWSDLARGRNDVKVELVKHNFAQSSIVMTIQGSDKSDEVVVLGGHADSIAGMWSKESARAPGADDNASGIATITEVIRILMNNSYKPRRTVQFMGYAGEEAGLLGSKDIAAAYKKAGAKVVGVMQLDMTLNKGTVDKDIVFMSDFTNTAQNEFLGKLVDEYVKVPWGYSKCGYGCSDHASWTANGYPASIPFESTMENINRKIHTDKDTLEGSGGDASHAAKFAKLATAYIVELAH